MHTVRPARTRRGGFTLIEVLIVVVILALLASMVIPVFGRSIEDSEVTAFIQDLRTFVEAAGVYIVKTNSYLPAAAPGAAPPGWQDYVEVEKWTAPTPIGGLWDVEYDNHGLLSGLGVDFTASIGERGDAFMQRIDQTLDDGDLADGRFRKVADGKFYFILEELVILPED